MEKTKESIEKECEDCIYLTTPSSDVILIKYCCSHNKAYKLSKAFQERMVMTKK
jgi:hypothetical protein